MSIIPLLYEMKLSLTLPFIPLLLSYLLKHTSSFNVAIKSTFSCFYNVFWNLSQFVVCTAVEKTQQRIWVCSTQIEADESSHQHRATKSYFESKMCKNILFFFSSNKREKNHLNCHLNYLNRYVNGSYLWKYPPLLMCKIQISKCPIVHWARAAVVLLVILRKNGYILSICTAARISFFFDFFRLFNFNHKTLLFPPFKSFLNVKRWAGWSLHANRIKAVIVNIRKINTQFTRTLEKLNKNTFEPYSTTTL